MNDLCVCLALSSHGRAAGVIRGERANELGVETARRVSGEINYVGVRAPGPDAYAEEVETGGQTKKGRAVCL